MWRRRLAHVALVAPLTLFMVVFYLIPLVGMLLRSVTEPQMSLHNFLRIGSDPLYLTVFWATTRMALIVTVAALVIGYPCSFALARMSRRRANLLMILVLMPFWTSILVRSYAWMVMLGRNGIINQALLAAGVIDAPIRMLNTPFAIAVAMTQILLPYMILPTYNALLELDPALPRAAAGLGARPAAVFRRVWLPLSSAGMAAGCLLVFVLALGFYITPALVGGPRDIMVSMLIQQQVDLPDWPFAAALGVTLLVVTLAIVLGFNRVFGINRLVGGLAR